MIFNYILKFVLSLLFEKLILKLAKIDKSLFKPYKIIITNSKLVKNNIKFN